MKMTPTPPAHICGRMRGRISQDILDARRDWIAAAHDSGASAAEIGDALGVGPRTVRQWLKAAGRCPLRRPGVHNASSRGVYVGYVGAALTRLPPAVYDRLEARCARTGETLAEALVSFWEEAAA